MKYDQRCGVADFPFRIRAPLFHSDITDALPQFVQLITVELEEALTMHEAQEQVYCYRLSTEDCFKIGRTKNDPDIRMRGFATGSPTRLNFYRTIKTEYPSDIERYLHVLLDDKRTENGEFFKVTAPELDSALDRAATFVERSQPLILKAEELRLNRPNNTTAESSLEMFQAYRELRARRGEKYLIEQEIAFLESRIKVAIGNSCGMKGIALWQWTDRWTMDMTRFKSDHDALYQQYKRNSGSRTFRLDRTDLTQFNQFDRAS